MVCCQEILFPPPQGVKRNLVLEDTIGDHQKLAHTCSDRCHSRLSRCHKSLKKPSQEGIEANGGERGQVQRLTQSRVGTQSAGGSRFVETMLTVMETCRQQSQNAN